MSVRVSVCDCEKNHSCFSMCLIVLCLWLCICMLHMLSSVYISYVETFGLQLSFSSPAITLLVWLRGRGGWTVGHVGLPSLPLNAKSATWSQIGPQSGFRSHRSFRKEWD